MCTGIEKLLLPKSLEEFSENDALNNVLQQAANWASIPLVNYTPLHELKDHSLVRFRGMIQDMLDPEIYLEKYEVKGENGVRIQDGKYRDCLVLKTGEKIDYDAPNNVQGERRTLFVISIPGINEWAHSYELDCNKQNLHKPQTETAKEENTNSKKRFASEEEENMDVDIEIPTSNSATTVNDSNKRLRMQMEEQIKTNVKTKTAGIGFEYLLNSPIPERPSLACMIKIYNNFDDYVLNSVIDVVGFLSVDPALDGSTIEDEMCKDFDNLAELQAQNPPPSLIPRLHAIAVHKLPHCNPLLDERILPFKPHPALDSATAFKDLHMMLTLCLFNDALAADYLISHLISTVYNRSEMQSIGKFSLNICNLPKENVTLYTTQLYEILELLLPASHYLPMTLETMNTAAFVPKKDYETNKLVSGLLQLAPHTHLVLDETHMQQGQLDSNGVMAIQNLAHLINHQQIKCNFQYYDIDYNIDVPVLVLSEGRTMLPIDFSIPIETDKEATEIIMETLKAAQFYLSPERVDQFRRFITQAKTCEFTMNPEDTEMIQTDFVTMRKENKISNADELHSLLVLSRLMAIARGKQVLDKASWELAKEMEEKRKQRIKNLPKSSRLQNK